LSINFHCFVVMASDRNNPERSLVERQHLPVVGATLPFGEKKGSKRYRVALASSTLGEKTFDRCLRNQRIYDSQAVGFMESQIITLQSRSVGLPSLPPHLQ